MRERERILPCTSVDDGSRGKGKGKGKAAAEYTKEKRGSRTEISATRERGALKLWWPW